MANAVIEKTEKKTPVVKRASKTATVINSAKEVSGNDVSANSANSVVDESATDLPVVSKITNMYLANLREDFKVISERFVRIGYTLYQFREDKLYKELGYKRFDDFIKTEFCLSKGTAYGFINVAERFTMLDANGRPTLTIKKGFKDFTSSQLVAMLSLDDKALETVSPTDSVRAIKEKAKAAKIQAELNAPEETEVAADKPKPLKPGKDMPVPVNRLLLGLVDSFDGISAFKSQIDRFMEKRDKDGVDYKIEVNITWPLDENLANIDS